MSRLVPITDMRGGFLDRFLRRFFCALDSLLIGGVMVLVLGLASVYLIAKFLYQSSPTF